MARSRIKPTLIKPLWALALAALMASCQGGMRSQNTGLVATESDDPHLTGASKISYDPQEQITHLVPYTGTGHTEVMREIRRQVNPKTFNPDLSKQIAYAHVNIIRAANAQKPESVKVVIGLRPEGGGWTRPLEFEGPLKPLINGSLGNAGVLVKNSDQYTEARYQLALACRDIQCDEVQLILQKIDLNIPSHQAPTVSDETGILYTRHETQYRVRETKGTNSTPVLTALTQSGATERSAIQESVEVLDGPAYVRVRVPGDKPGQDVLVVEGELLRTTDQTSDLQRAEVGDHPLKGVLLGNNEKGDIAIRLRSDAEGKEGEVTVFFERPGTDRPPVQPEFKVVDSEVWSSHPSAVIAVNFSDPKLSKAQEVTRQLEKFRVNPYVQEFIQYWTGAKKYRQCGKGASYNMKPRAMNFFHKMKALVPYTTPIFQHLDVTPEMLYISALESQFAISEGWIIEATKLPAGANPKYYTAAGPFQITETASRYLRNERSPNLNFVTFPIQEDRSVNPQDDRGFFLPTTYAAASYTKDLMGWFPEHPELWPLGYTEGQGALAVSMKCSLMDTAEERESCKASSNAGAAMNQRDRYRSATLDDIVRFKMAPCAKLDYVLLYLALKFVGANMSEFNLQFDQAKVPKELPKLYREGQNQENLIPTMLK